MVVRSMDSYIIALIYRTPWFGVIKTENQFVTDSLVIATAVFLASSLNSLNTLMTVVSGIHRYAGGRGNILRRYDSMIASKRLNRLSSIFRQ